MEQQEMTLELAMQENAALREALRAAEAQSILLYLSEEQKGALLGKADIAKMDFVKEATDGKQDDTVFAFLTYHAVKDADNAIFSGRRQSLIFDLLREYRGFSNVGNEAPNAANALRITWSKVDAVVETCASEISRCKNLLEAVKKTLLKGKTAMAPDDERPFTEMCKYMGVDYKSLK